MLWDLQRTSIGPKSAAGAGSLVNLFLDEHMNLAPLLCRLNLYVMVRFATDLQWSVSIYTFDVFFRSVKVFDETFFSHIASDP